MIDDVGAIQRLVPLIQSMSLEDQAKVEALADKRIANIEKNVVTQRVEHFKSFFNIGAGLLFAIPAVAVADRASQIFSFSMLRRKFDLGCFFKVVFLGAVTYYYAGKIKQWTRCVKRDTDTMQSLLEHLDQAQQVRAIVYGI